MNRHARRGGRFSGEEKRSDGFRRRRPQDRTEGPAGDDIDRTCAQCGLPGGNEIFFSDGAMVRLHRECETPYRHLLEEGQGPQGSLPNCAISTLTTTTAPTGCR